MLTKELGKTGINIPELGIGTWNYHAGPAVLRRGLETGALFIDTAESYGTEDVVREAIAGMGGRVFIATKVSPQNFRAKDFENSVNASLKRLAVERIDLLQLHEPNPAIPIEEPMGALASLIDAGKVRFAGVSNFSVSQLQDGRRALGKHPIVSNQVRYSIIDRTIEKDLLPYCQANGVTVIAYCPLARGLSRIRDCDPSGVIEDLSRSLDRSPAQIVLNWSLCKAGVVAIPKGNSEAHVLDNCGASDWRLSKGQLQLLDTKIQFRHRTAFDGMIRRSMPHGLQNIAIHALKYLPRGLRRRIR